MRNSLKYSLIYRCTVIVWLAVKFIFQIALFHFRHRIWDERTKKKWDKLLVKLAKEYRIKAVRLGGVLIKVGQFLSTRTDFMPDVFIKELTGLVDRVPPMEFNYAKFLLEKEWGTEIYDHLKVIEKSSIASASIGEVYRAILKDGTHVAIKVQRYRIQEIFHKDFRALNIVFWILSVFTSFGKTADLKALYRELIYVMDRELDFEKELGFGEYFKERYKDNESIHIPSYYNELSTKKVLVMEWIDGTKITDLKFMKRHHINVEQTAKNLFDFYLDQFLNVGKFHADPHAGNVLIKKDGRIGIIDFGMVREITKQDTHYFKLFVQGLIIDNYDIVFEALDEMNFILPNANKKNLKKTMKQTLEMYQNGSFNNMDAQTLDQLKEEIISLVKNQPIQLPADYAYLGRAISIVVGILFAIYPDIDMEAWAKPKIKKWFGSKNLVEIFYKQYAKETVEPLLSFPRAMLNWLESGEKDRQWEKEKQQMKFKHHFYLLLEVISFIMVVIGIGTVSYGLILSLPGMIIIASVITVIFIVIISIILFKHFRMIRNRM
ncbi:ABC transporter [Virgibacillus profundi]|uniref:ABC transporter n=1 Tax=Virgibacillus profundi TaxID=2024555 RepID=A0A2A2IJY6_9BACI|nr:AarF/UbiB family protein [Virgibacillus profundi]PAV31423.1 ABC transporter [Virgibacillus profundi]PXY55609.1 AarF/ABC1/UbiB kinase family protein [Virgibacillus profundi]